MGDKTCLVEWGEQINSWALVTWGKFMVQGLRHQPQGYFLWSYPHHPTSKAAGHKTLAASVPPWARWGQLQPLDTTRLAGAAGQRFFPLPIHLDCSSAERLFPDLSNLCPSAPFGRPGLCIPSVGKHSLRSHSRSSPQQVAARSSPSPAMTLLYLPVPSSLAAMWKAFIMSCVF